MKRLSTKDVFCSANIGTIVHICFHQCNLYKAPYCPGHNLLNLSITSHHQLSLTHTLEFPWSLCQSGHYHRLIWLRSCYVYVPFFMFFLFYFLQPKLSWNIWVSIPLWQHCTPHSPCRAWGDALCWKLLFKAFQVRANIHTVSLKSSQLKAWEGENRKWAPFMLSRFFQKADLTCR